MVWLIVFNNCGFCSAKAEDVVPCLIFTGNADNEYNIDIGRLNRITFGENGMTISSSNDNSADEIQLLYSLYHHLEIGDAKPTVSASLDEISVDSHSQFKFQCDTETLVIDSSSDATFDIGVFSLNGILLATSKLKAGQELSVSDLSRGAYIAVASDGNLKLTLKFILK